MLVTFCAVRAILGCKGEGVGLPLNQGSVPRVTAPTLASGGAAVTSTDALGGGFSSGGLARGTGTEAVMGDTKTWSGVASNGGGSGGVHDWPTSGGHGTTGGAPQSTTTLLDTGGSTSVGGFRNQGGGGGSGSVPVGGVSGNKTGLGGAVSLTDGTTSAAVGGTTSAAVGGTTSAAVGGTTSAAVGGTISTFGGSNAMPGGGTTSNYWDCSRDTVTCVAITMNAINAAILLDPDEDEVPKLASSQSPDASTVD